MTLTSDRVSSRVAVTLGIVVIGAIASLLRVPIDHLDTVWAEDGTIFLREALDHGPFSVLLTGYAGYQHLIPRLVAAAALGLAPLDAYGLLVFITCSVLVGLVAAAIFWLSRDLVTWMPARLALAAITIVLPLSAQEVLGNLADFHTYCLWLAPWLLLYRPRSWRGGAGWGVVALLLAATEIQAAIFLPLALLVLRRDHRYAWPVMSGFILGMIAQFATAFLTPRDSTAAWLGVKALVQGYLYNTVLPLLNPNPEWQEAVLVASGIVVPVLVVLPFIAAAVLAFVYGTARQRMLVVTLVYGSIVVFVAGATVDGSWGFAYTSHDTSTYFPGILNSRYGVSSGLLLAATVPVAASVLVGRAAQGTRARAVRIASAVALVALIGWFSFASTQTVSSRETGVTWSGGVRDARAVCLANPGIDPKPTALIAPKRWVSLNCDELVGD